MPDNNFIFVLVAVVIVLIGCIAFKKMNYFLNFLTRLTVGALALFLSGQIMSSLALQGQLAINPANVLIVGVLGIPGFIALLCSELYYLS